MAWQVCCQTQKPKVERMAESTRRVSIALPETIARLSKSQAALAGQTFEQFLRDIILDKVLREPASTS